MMKQEFIERTKYNPSDEEYHYIEESYYESDCVDKNEFCKQWVKDVKSGKWLMELRFRKLLDQQKAEYEKQLAEKEENLVFYRQEFKKGQEAQKKLRDIEGLLKGTRKVI
jgi:hypothetical protein